MKSFKDYLDEMAKFPMKETVVFDSAKQMDSEMTHARRSAGNFFHKASQIGDRKMQFTIKNMMQLRKFQTVARQNSWDVE